MQKKTLWLLLMLEIYHARNSKSSIVDQTYICFIEVRQTCWQVFYGAGLWTSLLLNRHHDGSVPDQTFGQIAAFKTFGLSLQLILYWIKNNLFFPPPVYLVTLLVSDSVYILYTLKKNLSFYFLLYINKDYTILNFLINKIYMQLS